MDLNEISPYIRVAWHSTLRPGYKIKKRVIYDYELIYVLGGECDITIAGKSYIVKKNDAVLLRPGIPHSFTCGESRNFVQPHIHFDLVYSEKSRIRTVCFKDLPELDAEERTLIQEDEFSEMNIPYVFTPDDPDAFQLYFFRAIDAFRSKSSNYQLVYKENMLKLIDMILKQFDTEASKESGGEDGVTAALTVKSYIDSGTNQFLTLEALSEQFHINKFTLMRYFKAVCGDSIIHYYNTRRTERAKHLLRSTNLSIGAVSEELSFSDIYLFSRFFKKNVGVSPSAFRRRG